MTTTNLSFKDHLVALFLHYFFLYRQPYLNNNAPNVGFLLVSRSCFISKEDWLDVPHKKWSNGVKFHDTIRSPKFHTNKVMVSCAVSFWNYLALRISGYDNTLTFEIVRSKMDNVFERRNLSRIYETYKRSYFCFVKGIFVKIL